MFPIRGFDFLFTVILSMVSIIIVVLCIYSIWRMRKSPKKRKRIIVLSVIAYSITSFLITLVYLYFGFDNGQLLSAALVAPLQILQSAIPIIFAVWLGKWIWPALLEDQQSIIPYFENPSALKEYVVRILDSQEFLTALRDTLPRGKDDEANGFDHIPYMLKTINDRRESFSRKASRFLFATVFLGIILGVIVMYFGYILVNEAAAGTPRILAEMHTQTGSISENLNTLLPRYYQNQAFQNNSASSLGALETTKPGEKNMQTSEKVNAAIAEAKLNGNIIKLFDILKAVKADV